VVQGSTERGIVVWGRTAQCGVGWGMCVPYPLSVGLEKNL
jgi:hypothetical protein